LVQARDVRAAIDLLLAEDLGAGARCRSGLWNYKMAKCSVSSVVHFAIRVLVVVPVADLDGLKQAWWLES
jgi:hypothetical protein